VVRRFATPRDPEILLNNLEKFTVTKPWEEAKTHTGLQRQQRTGLFLFVESKRASWRRAVNAFSFLLKAIANDPLEIELVL
jgi:hypothetical protein